MSERGATSGGFTIIEVLLTIGVLCMATAVSVPLYRNYLIRNDLELAKMNVRQGMERARFLAQLGTHDSNWGFSTDAVPGRGVLFKGESFALRDPAFDEMYSIANSIAVGGLSEVIFSKIDGQPSSIGEITLSTRAGTPLQASVGINADVIVTVPDSYQICLHPFGSDPQTLSVTNAQWAYYESIGAVIGACESQQTDSAQFTGTSISLTETAGAVSASDTYSCSVRFVEIWPPDIADRNRLTLRTFEGGEWKEPLGSNMNPVTSRPDIAEAIDCLSPSLSSSFDFSMEMSRWQKKRNWYSGESVEDWKRVVVTDSSDDDALVVVNADVIPADGIFSSENMTPLSLRHLVNFDDGKFVLPSNQALFVFDFGSGQTWALFLANFESA